MANTTATINPRPTVFGDRMIVTGSYTAGDGAGAVTIALADRLSSIDAIIVNPVALLNQPIEDGQAADGSDVVVTKVIDLAVFAGTTITITSGQGVGETVGAGTFLAIGRRS